MTQKLDIIVFDPAGNTTIMVLTPVPRSQYAETAKKLLEIDFGPQCSWRDVAYGEQVAFVVEEKNQDVTETPIMEMCGLEFCGNASRSYAYYRALFLGEGEDAGEDKKKVNVRVSGCGDVLTAVVDPNRRDSVIQMPLPVDLKMIDTAPVGIEGNYPLVVFDGISHIVIPDVFMCGMWTPRISKAAVLRELLLQLLQKLRKRLKEPLNMFSDSQTVL